MYKTIEIKQTGEDTEKMLNQLEGKGYKLVCSYSGGDWLILHKL